MKGAMIVKELVDYFTDSRIAYMLDSDEDVLFVCAGMGMVHPDNYLKEKNRLKLEGKVSFV